MNIVEIGGDEKVAKKVVKKQAAKQKSSEEHIKVFGVTLTPLIIVIIGVVLLFTVLAPVGLLLIAFGGFKGLRKHFSHKKGK